MGKTLQSAEKKRKMTEIGDRRVNLKRSKSVRASLRMFSTKFLRNNDYTNLELANAMSTNIKEPNGFLLNAAAETILKTPMVHKKIKKVPKLTTPPSVIAPKAAALLQIPSQLAKVQDENCEGKQLVVAAAAGDCEGEGLVRGSGLRLSMNAHFKRRQGGRHGGMWNSVMFSSTSSRSKQ